MGQRANIVVIQGGKIDLYYCHWCAASLPADLFWGPEHAVAFARRQLDARTIGPEIPMRRPDLSSPSVARPPEPGAEGWLDDQYAEGGAVIDLDHHSLILFGGEELSWHVPLRRIYLELLQETWTGWQVRWAHLGILDLADYVGLPRKAVMTRTQYYVSQISGRVDPDRPLALGSVLFEDQVCRLLPLQGDVLQFLSAGPELVENARQEPGYSHLLIDDPHSRLPWGGFYIDVDARLVEFWAANTYNTDPATLIFGKWPGWDCHWLEDAFEAQLARLGDRLHWPLEGRDILPSWVESMVMHASSAAPSEATMQAMLEHARRDGYEGSPSPEVRTDSRHLPPQDFRQQVFDQAVANWRRRRQTS